MTQIRQLQGCSMSQPCTTACLACPVGTPAMVEPGLHTSVSAWSLGLAQAHVILCSPTALLPSADKPSDALLQSLIILSDPEQHGLRPW